MRDIMKSLGLLAGLLLGVTGTPIVCDDGSTPGPMRLQFADFLDTAAFPDVNKRVAYRQGMVDKIAFLREMFGAALEYKLYYYSDKGPAKALGCGWQAIQSPFIDAGSSGTLESLVTSDLELLGLETGPVRPDKYSSLSDAVYYSLRSEVAKWKKEKVDEDGLPVLRILAVGTDVAAWVGQASSANQWPDDLATTALEECVNYDYPSVDAQLIPVVKAFPDLGTYFLILSESNSAVSDIPDLASWYQANFFGWYLGGAKGYSQELVEDGHHASQSAELVRKIACDYWAEVAPTTSNGSCKDQLRAYQSLLNDA